MLRTSQVNGSMQNITTVQLLNLNGPEGSKVTTSIKALLPPIGRITPGNLLRKESEGMTLQSKSQHPLFSIIVFGHSDLFKLQARTLS